MFRSSLLSLSALLIALPFMSPASAEPAHIALLLPQSGRMAKAAETIRDGFLAAWYHDNAGQPLAAPQLDFYDSDSDSLPSLLQEAQRNGATLIVGPLDRERLDALTQTHLESLPPLLALNSIDAQLPNVYQFALSPEDEIARLVAWMKAQGITNPLLMYSNDSSSQRQLRFFQTLWQSQTPLTTLVLNSTQKGGLVAHLKTALPTISNADAIFLASPTLANQILPSLLYFRNRTPVYSLSSAWTPTADGSSQRDVEGLRFCDLPWMLDTPRPEQEALYQAISRPNSSYDRLYAFGADAWSLTQQWLALSDGEKLSLRSGLIQTDATGHLRRTPTCAEVRNGTATPVWLPNDSTLSGDASGNRRSSLP